MTIEEMMSLLRTLERIEVHGESNLDALLACVRFIKDKIDIMQKGGDGE